MIDSSRGWIRSRRWEYSFAALGGVAALCAIAFACAIALPPTIANIQTSASDGVSPFVLEESGETAALSLPQGWVVERRAAGEVVVWTPDGRMSADVSLTLEPSATAIERVIEAKAPLQIEILASGLTMSHVHRAGGAGSVAAVSLAGVSEGPTLLVVTGPTPDAAGDYDLALAELLEGVR
ncbi:hypothetical protein [uncultured Microbacterium sp.]|uniref:hypothetical protein n=1 Tax=uncultured Microbacterium sp. TaxID=191216 RepID=UPI0028D6FEDA|nr:hypothetical protein [uncultured Microbacterium sp.]